MYSLLIQKELKNILFSPKFTATFLVCSILIVISVLIGIREYDNAVLQYETNQQIARSNIEEATNWTRIRNIAHRKPIPMQIFVSGLHFDIGRLSDITTHSEVKLRRSPYSDETLFAIFRFIDLTFIVQLVLSLFAILFTYDAINGERENGTLKLAFSNPVSRIKYLISKFTGIWIGLVVPLLIPFLIGVLLVMLFRVPMDTSDWISLAGFVGLSLLYITFFICIGFLISSVTRKSSLSFLLLLVIWVGVVLILPRLGVITAGQIIQVESVAQTEARQQAFQHARWNEYVKQIGEVWKERNQQMKGLTETERQTFRDNKEWEWLQQDDAHRKQVQIDITENNRLLLRETLHKKQSQQNLAFNLSRLSPASSFRLAAMNIVTTDIDMKTRYEESMRRYRDTFSNYVNKKKAESGDASGFRIEINSDKSVKMNMGRQDQKLDISDLPGYEAPREPLSATLGKSILDFGLLSILIVITFGFTFIAFLKYDMR